MNGESHSRDSDCTLDDFDCCVFCGVWHGDPCPVCGGRGYHAEDCEVITLVSESLRCPSCGENRMDFIHPDENELATLECLSCRTRYRFD